MAAVQAGALLWPHQTEESSTAARFERFNKSRSLWAMAESLQAQERGQANLDVPTAPTIGLAGAPLP